MTCIKMGSDESHFNVSVGSDGQSHRTVSTNQNLFEEKGEPKRIRTEGQLSTLIPLLIGKVLFGIRQSLFSVDIEADRAATLSASRAGYCMRRSDWLELVA